MLAEKIWGEHPIFLQSSYADDFSMAGEGEDTKKSIFRTEALGTAHRFFLEP